MFNRRSPGIIAAVISAVMSPLDGYAPSLRPLRVRRNRIQPPTPAVRVRTEPMVVARERRYKAEARRLRQIERGTLNICNGLVVPGLRYLGHGFALHAESGRIIDARM